MIVEIDVPLAGRRPESARAVLPPRPRGRRIEGISTGFGMLRINRASAVANRSVRSGDGGSSAPSAR